MSRSRFGQAMTREATRATISSCSMEAFSCKVWKPDSRSSSTYRANAGCSRSVLRSSLSRLVPLILSFGSFIYSSFAKSKTLRYLLDVGQSLCCNTRKVWLVKASRKFRTTPRQLYLRVSGHVSCCTHAMTGISCSLERLCITYIRARVALSHARLTKERL
jgi:hypothetical protein